MLVNYTKASDISDKRSHEFGHTLGSENLPVQSGLFINRLHVLLDKETK